MNLLRVTTIVYDGRKPEAKNNIDDLVLNVDIAPTILDYAGISIPPSMQGKSLKPLIDHQDADWRKEFYYNHLLETSTGKVYLPKSEGLVMQGIKYVRYFNGNNPDEYFYEDFFYTTTDPFEVNNLANNSTFADRKKQLIERMKSLRKSLE